MNKSVPLFETALFVSNSLHSERNLGNTAGGLALEVKLEQGSANNPNSC